MSSSSEYIRQCALAMEEGYAAGRVGVRGWGNPYQVDDSLRRVWQQGWRMGSDGRYNNFIEWEEMAERD